MKLILWLLAVLALTSCARQRIETYQDKNVTAREQNPVLYPFNVHGSRDTILTVFGKSYAGVRGTPPYYLEIPELNSILFVTEERKSKITFHIVNVQSKTEIKIDGSASGFGGHIGSKAKAGAIGSDYVQKAEGKRIWISKRSVNWRETAVLNLDTQTVERLETDYFNASGEVTNRSVQTSINLPRK